MVWFSAAGIAAAQSVASPWVDHERARSRLVAAEHAGRLLAFVEIELQDGWKTYWRNPGDTGGLPPTFEFDKSGNVAGARVLFPAPHRLTDRAGDTIGYKSRVVFPVEIDKQAAEQPVHLQLSAHFGVCREICVPLEAAHELDVPAGAVGPADGDLLGAIDKVPRDAGGAAKAGDPKLLSARALVADGGPRVVFETQFASDATGQDLFVEAPDGLYVPMTRRSGDGSNGVVEFTSTIASEPELKQLIGKSLKVTMVSDSKSAEAIVLLQP